MAFKKKSAKIEAVEAVKNEEVRTVARNATKESVADQLAKLQVTLNNSLGDVAAKYQETLSTHEKLVQANKLEAEELERLNKIKVSANTLAELEATIDNTRSDWSKEQETEKETRSREQEEYEYNLAKERKEDEDKYLEKLRNRERDMSVRESNLSSREEEFKELQFVKNSLDEVKKKHADAQVAIVTNVLKKDFKHEMDLVASKQEAEKTVLNAQVTNLQNQVQNLTEQVTNVRVEMERARNDAKEIASKALEASSNREALSSLQAALQNQNNKPSGK